MDFRELTEDEICAIGSLDSLRECEIYHAHDDNLSIDWICYINSKSKERVRFRMQNYCQLEREGKIRRVS